MTVVAAVAIALAFASGARGALFVTIALVSVSLAGVEIAGGQVWRGLTYLFCVQGAYVVGLLLNAMRR